MEGHPELCVCEKNCINFSERNIVCKIIRVLVVRFSLLMLVRKRRYVAGFGPTESVVQSGLIVAWSGLSAS